MRITISAVAKGRNDQALPPTTLSFASDEATLATVETEQRPTVLGLIASGRMKPDAGEVKLHPSLGSREADAASIRRRIALVDAIGVSQPDPAVSTAGVVAEELMFAGVFPRPRAAAQWLEEQGLAEIARVPFGDVEPADRLRILLELAVLRAEVEGLILVSPDRHGGEPAVWWGLAEEFAERGYAVLVIAGLASRTALGDALVSDTSTKEQAS